MSIGAVINGTFTLLNTLTPYVVAGLKFSAFAQSGSELGQDLLVTYRQNKWNEPGRVEKIAGQGTKFLLHSANLAFNYTPLRASPDSVKLLVNVATGGLEARRNLYANGEWKWDRGAVAIVLFSAANCVDTALLDTPVLFGNMADVARSGSDIAKIVLLGNRAYDWSQKRREGPQGPQQPQDPILTLAQDAEGMETARTMYNEAMAEFGNLETLDHIPNAALIPNRDFWKDFKCQISKKPIRFLYAPKENPNFVYYEKKVIEDWIAKNPNTPPPGWPKNVPLTLNNIKPCPEIQHLIDSRLRKAHDELQNNFRLLEEAARRQMVAI